MTVTPERFAQGLTYEAYKARMTRNQARFEANERAVEFDPADLTFFKGLPHPLHVLVLAEDWCGDVIDNLPILGRLAAESGKLDVRVFPRDQNPDLMDGYLKEGQFRSIPVFVFFDQDFRELGHFIERPESVTARRAHLRQDLFARHPEFGSSDTPVDQLSEDARVTLMQEMTRWRDEGKAEDNRDVVRTMRDIAERVPAGG